MNLRHQAILLLLLLVYICSSTENLSRSRSGVKKAKQPLKDPINCNGKGCGNIEKTPKPYNLQKRELISQKRQIDTLSDAFQRLALHTVMLNRIPSSNHRYITITLAMKLMIDRNVVNIVETGTSRDGEANCLGDGCSTVIFGHFGYLTNRFLWSVDISQENVDHAIQGIQMFGENSKVITSDSIAFLESYPFPIDFLYLDSYDFDANNPNPSQEHHLKEIKASYKNLHQNTIVMIDDCRLPHGGKCKLVTEFLLSNGWKLIVNEYQQIFVHSSSLEN
ncbi:unnamed protein product [Blepharisma stoltei]|uniref:O-methyltransferase n=1 Tax=Blepharisma stoltei TaxID=1481888 RepID=A0AAU9IY81_9CILI|nr:unnamed protein product [Blepharisma stoltei]